VSSLQLASMTDTTELLQLEETGTANSSMEYGQPCVGAWKIRSIF